MDRDELLEFLNGNTWDTSKQNLLVELWNELRGDSLGKITRSHVRTPCRLKQVRNSLRGFVKTEMVS